MQFLQAVSAIKGGLRRTSLESLFWYALQGIDQRGRYTIEKGIAVIQARENKTACRGRSCVDGEEWTDMPN